MKPIIINLYDGEPIAYRSFRLVIQYWCGGGAKDEWLWIRRDMFEGYELKDGSEILKENGINKGIVIESWEENEVSRGFTIPTKYLGRVADALKKLNEELNKEEQDGMDKD